MYTETDVKSDYFPFQVVSIQITNSGYVLYVNKVSISIHHQSLLSYFFLPQLPKSRVGVTPATQIQLEML